MRSLIHYKGGYDMKNANCPRFMVEFAGYVNKQCAGLASWDYYGARIRKTVASLEKGLISIDDAMRELVQISGDIRAEKESGVA